MSGELLLFAKSILYGAIMVVGYDVIRIFRRIVTHKPVWVIVEDMMYWIGSGLFVFSRIYQENSGILRGYIFIGLVLGMILWHFTIGERLVRGISFLVKRLKFSILRCKIALRKRCCRFFRKS